MVISRAASEVGQNLLGIGRKILGPQGSLHRKMVVGGALGGMGLKGMADVVVPGPNDTPETTAKMYRSQADKLAKEAANFRRLAEELVPTKKAK
jgi:hypothetical protein